MDKKQELMNEAMHLFSLKGFAQTSVQEIANAAGISKGAFYKHYESKESLFTELLKRYQENLTATLTASSFSGTADKKEAFKQKLRFEITQTLDNKEFFLMVFKDFPKDEASQMMPLFEELRASQLSLTRNSLLDVYGDKIQPFLTDLVAVLEGIKREYFFILIFENQSVDVKKLTDFIAGSIDAIVGVLGQLDPVLHHTAGTPASIDDPFNSLEEKIRRKLGGQEKLLSSLQLLKEETGKSDRQEFLIEALLAYLAQEPEIEKELEQLKKFI